MKLTSTQRTALWAAVAVATVGLAALVWWLTKHRAERSLSGIGSSGNIVTAAVQQVVDTTHQIMQGQYFTISELTRSATAQSHHIDNTPSPAIRVKLEALIVNCLDPIRRIYGRPVIVSSGYRCPQLNSLVGGVSTSQHTMGEAADLVPASGGSLGALARAAIQFGDFDQLILEQAGGSKWIHVSWREGNRRHKILAYRNGRYTDITNNWETYLASWA